MDCRHFEGTYLNRGEGGSGAGDTLSLASALFYEEGSPDNKMLAGVTRVSFSMPTPDVLEVTARDGLNPLHTRTLKRGRHFNCESGQLKLRGWDFTEGNMVFGVGRRTMSFSATDDHLVLRTKETGGGILFIVIPLGYSESSWYRFEREREKPPVVRSALTRGAGR